jgi:hypothetical protein
MANSSFTSASIPIQRYLVPEPISTLPEGFTAVTERITNGLPHIIRLSAQLNLVITLPTGLAVPWRDADPRAVVSCSESELTPAIRDQDALVGNVSRAPVRVVARYGQKILTVFPLISGRRLNVPVSDALVDAAIRVFLLTWDIRAGSVRGAGEFGSFITFGWQPIDQGVERFLRPNSSANLQTRLQIMQER